MTLKVGVWIDHQRAVVVMLREEQTDIKLIRLMSFRGDLNVYYRTVSDCVCAASSILIFGPGAAKNELKRCLEEKCLSDCIFYSRDAGEMNHHQVAAAVTEFFKPPGRNAHYARPVAHPTREAVSLDSLLAGLRML